MTQEVESEASITHASLVAEAAKWLRERCSVVMTELVTTGEVPDAIGWRGVNSFMIECKVSRADFLAEQRFRHELRLGVGRFRYYLAPSGLLTNEKLPTKWGLLELTNYGICERRKSERFEDTDTEHEIGMLLSALRRIGQNAPKGVSIKYYTIPSKNTATLGCEPLDPIDRKEAYNSIP